MGFLPQAQVAQANNASHVTFDTSALRHNDGSWIS